MKHLLFILILCGTSLGLFAQHAPLVIAHTSDTHSCIEPVSLNHPDTTQANKGGFARRASMLKQLRQKHPQNVIVVDCGDFSQGSVYYNLFKGEVEVKLMNAMKYDAVLIGNHEFDYGLDNLVRLIRLAQFPFVCSNYDFSQTPLKGMVKPYIIIERAGARVGIIGVSPKLEGLVSKDCYGKTKYKKPAKAVQPLVTHLREKEGCDIVVCLSHLGYMDRPDADLDFIANTKGIDIVLGGHTHSNFDTPKYIKNKEGKEVLLNHVGKNGQWVGTLTISK